MAWAQSRSACLLTAGGESENAGARFATCSTTGARCRRLVSPIAGPFI